MAPINCQVLITREANFNRFRHENILVIDL
jgi:hypothetical protein